MLGNRWVNSFGSILNSLDTEKMRELFFWRQNRHVKIFRSSEKQMKLRVKISEQQKQTDTAEEKCHVNADSRKKHVQNKGKLISLPVEKVMEKKIQKGTGPHHQTRSNCWDYFKFLILSFFIAHRWMAASWFTTNKVELKENFITASILYGFGAWIPMESDQGEYLFQSENSINHYFLISDWNFYGFHFCDQIILSFGEKQSRSVEQYALMEIFVFE